MWVFFFFSHTILAFYVICPFLVCLRIRLSHFPSPPSHLSPPHFAVFVMVMQKKKKKNLSCSNSFRALSIAKGGQFCFSSLVSVCWGLKVMKTIFHLHAVIRLGVARAGLSWENKYYRRSNVIIFISPRINVCIVGQRTIHKHDGRHATCTHWRA